MQGMHACCVRIQRLRHIQDFEVVAADPLLGGSPSAKSLQPIQPGPNVRSALPAGCRAWGRPPGQCAPLLSAPARRPPAWHLHTSLHPHAPGGGGAGTSAPRCRPALLPPAPGPAPRGRAELRPSYASGPATRACRPCVAPLTCARWSSSMQTTASAAPVRHAAAGRQRGSWRPGPARPGPAGPGR
jgi:hypothetical protein